MTDRARVVEVARSFIGTPYHPCGAIKGVGVDCGTLLAMVYVEAGVIAAFDPGLYSPQWHLHRRTPRYLNAVAARSREIEAVAAQPGDAVLYKMTKDQFAHGAIITAVEDGALRIIHAVHDLRQVLEGAESEFGTLAGRERKFFSPFV
jgi:cell wall-associated NlpC family hydrolase